VHQTSQAVVLCQHARIITVVGRQLSSDSLAVVSLRLFRVPE